MKSTEEEEEQGSKEDTEEEDSEKGILEDREVRLPGLREQLSKVRNYFTAKFFISWNMEQTISLI